MAWFIYGIIDPYGTPYTSEWLTADAFVPYYFFGALLLGLCMFFTWQMIRRRGAGETTFRVPKVVLRPIVTLLRIIR